MSSPFPAPTRAAQTYTGSCHCNKLAFTVTVSPPLSDPSHTVSNCNCSICSRNGYLLIYVKDENIKFEKGEKEMTKYLFNKNKIAHYFCPTCGTSCFAQSTDPEFYADYKALNVRTFHDLDLKGLFLKDVDGKSH